jgi:hypothetical protein
MKNLSIAIGCLVVAWVLGACANQPLKPEPGDILFQHNACGPLCESIDRVTEGYAGEDYNHCGLVVVQNDSLYVLEAIGADVHLTSLNDFYKRSGGTVTVGRLRAPYQKHVPALQKNALQFLGRPYDIYFELDNAGMYCSELIYEAAKALDTQQPLFALAPMTFRDPATGETFPPWAEYYRKLGQPVPEGKPGINPGLLSRSEKLTVFYITGE